MLILLMWLGSLGSGGKTGYIKDMKMTFKFMKQAGAELGQAQHKLGFDSTFL